MILREKIYYGSRLRSSIRAGPPADGAPQIKSQFVRAANIQLQLLSRLAGLGSFVGVRCTRFAHSAHPHCARRRILAFGSDPLFSARATSATGRTLGAIRKIAPLLRSARASGRRAPIIDLEEYEGDFISDI